MGGTGELLFYDEFQAEFDRANEDPAEFRSLLAFPYACQSLEHFASKHIPGEVDTKCALASRFADLFLSKIAARAIYILNGITEAEITLHRLMTPAHAVEVLRLHAEDPSQASAMMKDGKSQPGFESMVHAGTPLIDQLKEQHQALSDLSWAMDQYKAIKVRNYTLVPKEYLRDQVKAYLREVIQRELHQSPTTGTSGLLPRPSVLWGSVKSVMTSLRHLEAFINIDSATILESGLLEQVVAINAKEKTTVAQASDSPLNFPSFFFGFFLGYCCQLEGTLMGVRRSASPPMRGTTEAPPPAPSLTALALFNLLDCVLTCAYILCIF